MKSFFANNALVWCLSVLGAVGLAVVPFFFAQPPAEGSIDGRGRFDPSDLDGDGMSDSWETHYFGSVEARDGGEDDDLDDISNADEWFSGTDPLHLDPRSIGESGFVKVSQPDAGTWHTVRLDGSYSSPVVIMGPASYTWNSRPLTIRVKNVLANSFEFQFDEYDYLDGVHKSLQISWIVVEEGVHDLPNGKKIQAGYHDIASNAVRVRFNESFSEIPMVMSQVTTYHGTEAVTPRQWKVESSGFNVVLQNQQSSITHQESENLAWIAIEYGLGTGIAGKFEVAESGRIVDHDWTRLIFDSGPSREVSFMAMMQTTFGGDTATLRHKGLSSWGVHVRVQEEQSSDQETLHTTENVGYLVASPGMFHVLPTTGDTDADGIADSYELSNGLIVGELDFYGDLDGDGLSNAEEARHGTRADLADSDGDSVSDYDEVHFLESDALASDVGTFLLSQTVSGSAFGASFGEWGAENGVAQQQSTRGWVEYEITAPSAGVYAVELDLAPYSGANRGSQYELVFSLDGAFVSREQLEIPQGESGTAKILTPWLNSGAHTLRVFLDNSYRFRKAQIEELRLLAASGADSNDNGVIDWVEIRTQNQNGLTRSYAASRTSPVCLEGKGRFTDLIQSNQSLTIQQGPNDTWYADLHLDPAVPTNLQLSYENDALMEDESIAWIATNLLQESSLTIRQGDALRLTATLGEIGTLSEHLSFDIEGNQLSTTADQPLVYRFDQPGLQTIAVTYTDGSGTQGSHAVHINVVSRVAVSSPVCVVGFERPWEINGLPSEAIVQIDDEVAVFDGERLGNQGYAYTIATRSPESKYTVVRLGYSGPILGSTEIKGMTIRSSDKTGVTYEEALGNDTYRLEMPVVVNQAHPGVTVRCKIFLAGVMYLDGSTTADLEGEDFDEFGTHVLEFIKPPNAHSNCHRFSIWQGDLRIAFFD